MSALYYFNEALSMTRIMIVEDNQGTHKAIYEYLKTAEHTLFPALDGAEALNIFRDKNIDLAVLDIMLPKMSGLTVLYESRKISRIPVVMLTAVDDEYTQSNNFDELADAYIRNIRKNPAWMALLRLRALTINSRCRINMKTKLFYKIFTSTFEMILLITVLAHILIFMIAPSENVFITSTTVINEDILAFSEVDMPLLITQTILKSFPLSFARCLVISLVFSFLFS